MAASSPLVSHFGGMYGQDGIFQPPKASPSTKLSPSIAAGDYFSGGARKRQRSDSSQIQDGGYTRHSPWTATPGPIRFSEAQETSLIGSFGQASAFVNERYSLAGGYDTPSLQAASLMEGLSVHDEQSFRGRMTDDSLVDSGSSSHAMLSGPLARERNGVARINTNPAHPTWTSFAFSLVGKMFSFGGSMVRGFYAGGGKGYDLHHGGITPPRSPYDDSDDCSTPIPGAWDFGDLSAGPQTIDAPQTLETTSRPPNKRRQTDRDTWVMIGTPDLETAASTPSRRPSNLARNSQLGRTGASKANSRRGAAPVMTRNPAYAAPLNSSPLQAASPAPLSHDRRASIASVRSPHGRPSNTAAANAMVSPDAERFMRRQVRQDRAADKAMNSMSRRLEDLIRQGQQALGTKYSVECDDGMDEDEGFVDEVY